MLRKTERREGARGTHLPSASTSSTSAVLPDPCGPVTTTNVSGRSTNHVRSISRASILSLSIPVTPCPARAPAPAAPKWSLRRPIVSFLSQRTTAHWSASKVPSTLAMTLSSRIGSNTAYETVPRRATRSGIVILGCDVAKSLTYDDLLASAYRMRSTAECGGETDAAWRQLRADAAARIDV